jgi:hypothetical protein
VASAAAVALLAAVPVMIVPDPSLKPGEIWPTGVAWVGDRE